MTRYLLDTNIISNATKQSPSPALLAWMAEQNDIDLFISALTVAEIRRGLLEKPAGKKRAELDAWFTGPEGTASTFRRSRAPLRRARGSRLGATDG